MKRLFPAAFAAAVLICPLLSPLQAQDLLKPAGEGQPPALPEEPVEGLQSAPLIMAEGRIERIDRDRGIVTIAHDPVTALGWPAGTHRFHVIREQLDGLGAGDEVRFSFQGSGEAAAIMAIDPRR